MHPIQSTSTGRASHSVAPPSLFSEKELKSALEKVRQDWPQASLPAELLTFLQLHGGTCKRSFPFMNLAPACWGSNTLALQRILGDAEHEGEDVEQHRSDDAARSPIIQAEDDTLSLDPDALVFCMESNDGHGDLYFLSQPLHNRSDHALSDTQDNQYDLFVIQADTSASPYTVRVDGPLTWTAFQRAYLPITGS